MAAPWETPLAEMTIGAIAARLRGEAEALLVFHYADQADFGYDSGPAWLEQEGSANIYCTAAAFDTASGTRFLEIKPDDASITHAIQHDPRYVSRVVVEKDEKTGRMRVSFGLTEEEIVAAVVEYLCYGTAYESTEISERIVWRGLDGLLF